jgi:uncharacterized protein
MPTDLIRYDLLVQDALRGVVRKVLADTARDGLPGEHHFYITFRTHAPGVKLSTRLREQYPEEMTIILQYQFWNLKVDDHSFEVGLHFKNVPELLQVPYSAISGFYDPSVQFGLKFEAEGKEGDEFDEVEEESVEIGPLANAPAPLRDGEKPKIRGAASEPDIAPARMTSEGKTVASARSQDAAKKESPAKPPKSEAEGEAKVVSIDAFRKKP